MAQEQNILNAEQLKSWMKMIFRARRVPGTIGETGIGKSQIHNQVKEELGIDYLIDLRAGEMELSELTGMPLKPVPTMIEGFGEIYVTKYALPSWFPTNPNKSYLLLLDELNRSMDDVRQGMFKLVLDRACYGHKLPDSCVVATAINPEDKDYQVKSLDPAFMNRIAWCTFKSNFRVWEKWAIKHPEIIHDYVLRFLNSSTSSFHMVKENITPRTWEHISSVMFKMTENELNGADGMSVCQGYLNNTLGLTFHKFIKTQNLDQAITAKDLLKRYDSVARYINKICNPTKPKLELITETLNNIYLELSRHMNSYNEKEILNIVNFIDQAPRDSFVMFSKKIIDGLKQDEKNEHLVKLTCILSSDDRWDAMTDETKLGQEINEEATA